MKTRFEGITILIVLLFGTLWISCGQKHLPPITNAAALRRDCSTLYQQFPVDKTPTNAPDFEYQRGLGIRKIPEDKWPPSIAAMHPYMVCSYEAGLQIWIIWDEDKDDGGVAYYIPATTNSPLPDYNRANRFRFEKTEWDGIYQLKQKF